MDSYTTISIDEAVELCKRALTAAGTHETNAAIVSKALVRGEIDGHLGHGLSRLPSYVAQVRSGKIDGRAVPSLEDVKPGLIRVNAGFGFAYPAIQLTLPELEIRAAKTGIAAAAIYHSHHFGVAGHPCEDLARRGLISFIYGNSPKAIAPTGSKEKVLGTNPIAFGAPLDDDPLIIDFAVSTVARGKILAARQQGQPIPEGWAISPDGKPTTDPEIALQGSMLPIGGAKGAALALMVEVMSACLAGASLGVEASSLYEAQGPSPDLGQVILVIDSAALSGEAFSGRLRTLADVYQKLDGARFPGLSRLENRKKAAQEGLRIPTVLDCEIRSLAR
jgi:(2R)-3-sulfolactate dehydrogenase (NADP+)